MILFRTLVFVFVFINKGMSEKNLLPGCGRIASCNEPLTHSVLDRFYSSFCCFYSPVLSVFLCLFNIVWLSCFLSVCLWFGSSVSVCLSDWLAVWLVVHLFIHPHVRLSVHLSDCLSVCLSVCLLACLRTFARKFSSR